MEHNVSRREFFRGAGVATVAAGFAASGAVAWADTEQITAPATLADSYAKAAQDLAGKKGFEKPFKQPRGPVAYEAREIPASEIAGTEEVDQIGRAHV